ncbi:transposase [Streptomyces sp. NPDC055722]
MHLTETCDEGSVNVITDVATTVPTGDSVALPGIHTRLGRRRLLPAEHLVDSGYTSVVLHDIAARTHRVTMVGPVKTDNSRQHKTGDGFARENFIIDFDQREVTCPNGQVSGNWNELPAMAPYTVVRFDKRQCGPCPEKSSCTSGAARTVNFLPRRLHELQARNRADQQDAQWQRLYASRSGIEGTMNELVNGHQMRRCRYRGVSKTHVQHVLTAIAVNIERLSTQEPTDTTYRPRSPTAFQQYLDEHELPRPRWWRQGQ